MGLMPEKRLTVLQIGVEIEGTWLTPLRSAGSDRNGKAIFLFQCRCGVQKLIRKVNVTSIRGAGRTKSCGCYKTQFLVVSSKTANRFQKGDTPWNKGKKWQKKNREKIKWNRGRVRILHEDGTVEWAKVSDKVLGRHHKWCQCGCKNPTSKRKFGNLEWAKGEYELEKEQKKEGCVDGGEKVRD